MEHCTFCSVADVTDKIRAARAIQVYAYLLSADLESALDDAASRGADVQIRLNGRPFGAGASALAMRNTAAVTRMKAHGIDAELTSEPVLHLKAAVVDGVTYFDDRNWSRAGDAVLCDPDPAAAAALAAAVIDGRARDNDGLALHKGAALTAEEALLRAHTGGALRVVSETIGPCDLTRYLSERSRYQPVEVVVNERTLAVDHAMQHEVALLQAAGVEVRAGATTEKLAVAGDAAWYGSANATSQNPNSLDWGAVVSPPISTRLGAVFDSLWTKARAVSLSGA